MTNVDVAVVGGGPAGSTCARALVSAGLDVVVLDRAAFPRDKVCAGWITPEVVRLLELDLTDYARDHVLEPFRAFRVSVMGQPATLIDYGTAVSYGIRRSEFDHYLLRRTGAPVVELVQVTHLERVAGRSIVDGQWAARYLVGAGGHHCPVARALNPGSGRESVVVAQRGEAEFAVGGLTPGTPELCFSGDLHGYGWLVPKGTWVNVGLGRDDPHRFSSHVRAFADDLVHSGRMSPDAGRGWHGHAYLLASASVRRIVGDHVVLIGDAAGVASSGSGEGIRGAVLSGQLAAEAIGRCAFVNDRLGLPRYADALRVELGVGRRTRPAVHWLPRAWRTPATMAAFRSPTFVRHILLNRMFLHGTTT